MWGRVCAELRSSLDGRRARRHIVFHMSLLTFYCHRYRVSAAQTERGDAAFHVAADHFIDQRDQHAGAAGTDGMADGDGAAVYVYLVGIEAELAHHAQRLH